MKITTNILLMCLFLTSCRCQEPDTIICYSEEDMALERQLLYDTIEYFEDFISSLIINPDSFNLSLESGGIIINVRRDDNIQLSIIEGDKRSHLWLINGKIQARFAVDTVQGQTWLPEQHIIKY